MGNNPYPSLGWNPVPGVPEQVTSVYRKVKSAADTLFLLAGRLSQTRKCSKVFRTYPLEFRTPVEKIGMESTHTLYLRFGDQGGTPFTLRAKDALVRGRWPVGITDGVWFAGDEPFGGAIIVPGSGEMLFLQPRDWAATDEDRANAGLERTEKAGRAGIRRPARR